jgi:hypothetical protein
MCPHEAGGQVSRITETPANQTNIISTRPKSAAHIVPECPRGCPWRGSCPIHSSIRWPKGFQRTDARMRQRPHQLERGGGHNAYCRACGVWVRPNAAVRHQLCGRAA